MNKQDILNEIEAVLSIDSDFEALEVNQFDIEAIVEALDEAILEQANELLEEARSS